MAEERARIARELHDVVAHAISVVVVQARGGRKVLASDPEASRTAFDSIERTGEQALGEMRRLLGMLRDDDEEHSRAPQPSLERVEASAEEMRASGLPVELEVDGRPERDPARHRRLRLPDRAGGPDERAQACRAGGRPGRRAVRTDAVEITVADDGRGGLTGAGTGNGLLGIRERVAVVGGEIEAGPQPDGGFAVHARLPYRDDT